MTDRRLRRWRLHRLGVIAACFAVATIVATILTARASSGVAPAADAGDSSTYQQVVARMRSGADYYTALEAMLRARDYPIASVFNWRMPLLYAGIARVHDLAALAALWSLAVALLVRARSLMTGLLGPLPLITVLFTVAAPPALFFPEVWAGLCLGHSAVSYARDRWTSGVAWAVSGLFVRELAAPYCVVAGLRAIWRREWREVAAWGAGAAAFGAYYAWHVSQVAARIRPGDPAHREGWIALGGPAFMLYAFREGSGLLGTVHPFVFGLAFAGAVGAYWSRLMPWHVRGGVLTYAVFFLFAGQPFNGYWGFVAGPLFGLWLTYADRLPESIWPVRPS